MRKILIISLALITSLFLIGNVLGAVRINEVMADPDLCADADCEYIEIYTDTPVNLTDWIIDTGTPRTFTFELQDYLIITRDKNIFVNNYSVDESKVIELVIGLNNAEDNILLLNNNSELISNFTYNSSTAGISWQYCSEEWIENNPTPGADNNCTINNNENNETTPPEENNDPEIDLKINWDEDDIINMGEEFKIEVEVFNLEDEFYNLKIWIKDEDDDVISERYDSAENGWGSGRYYVDKFFEGPDDETRKIKLRLRSSYEDVHGDDFDICFKLEDYEDTEDCRNIEILEKDEEEGSSNDVVTYSNTNANTQTNNAPVTTQVIKLGSSSAETEDLKEQKDIIYQARSELIKKYAIIAFAVFVVAFGGLMAFHNKNKLKKVKKKKK